MSRMNISRGCKKSIYSFGLLFFLEFCFQVHGLACDSNSIACEDRTKCVQIRYICDGDGDCSDRSDEAFCPEWNQSGCSRGEARCNGHNSCVSMTEYCQKAAINQCSGVVDPRICHMLRNRRIQRLSNVVLPTTPTTTTTLAPTEPPPRKDNLLKSEEKGRLLEDSLNITLSHPECPKLYTKIGEHCLSLFFFLKIGWDEARVFCEAAGGQLATFANDGIDFITITKYLQDMELMVDFWIGGRYKNENKSWKWISGEDMDLGPPFWAVRYNNSCVQREGMIGAPYWLNTTACYHYQQAPKPDTFDLCAAITYRHYYYTTDEDCLTPRSPLCLHNGSLNSSSSFISNEVTSLL